MRRVHRLASFLSLFLAVWIGGVLQLQGSANRSWCSLAVLWAPALAILSLGCYLLARLMYGVMTFSSYPRETVALQQELQLAKEKMSEQGLWFAD
ncbi:dolichol-phosphate mannosyltransferase subunit 3 [Dunaliella salina]|uniref:Dolichol-phosphate mannosyltransferase subunit 3 n=1 Tax=Dunaliella salina TaxID=3046 RepID=A0ABQ7G551_DUNSA|nr:dolichol-phosphate mannosyltransferase subunit 3 [Dunaliella salina]|eukprot:KAF5829734.1 dolichol-phosphate mannosyltransferase subunit 3 [Dunaliella salina]